MPRIATGKRSHSSNRCGQMNRYHFKVAENLLHASVCQADML